MKKFLSKQKIARGLLAGLSFFIWGFLVPTGLNGSETLFCYTRDASGNKALVRDFGEVYVEDVFVMEIPSKEWEDNESATVTIILEDEDGNRKVKTIELAVNQREE